MCDTVIETARLYLRHFRNGDEYDLFEYLSEPEVNCLKVIYGKLAFAYS